ncbi:unnamed protein product [Prorocentrum cordatum]|uniref:Uncharacterized protein n=1 Tax=Prorocentrum cordatum TaxID=2364126 RepID=A0ABN9PP78_9DINO|nr:unnamed protein product [Polarella glacialis]
MQQALGVVQAEIDALAPLRGGHSELLEQIKLYGSMEERGHRPPAGGVGPEDRRPAAAAHGVEGPFEAIASLASELESAVDLEPELQEQLRGALERGAAGRWLASCRSRGSAGTASSRC